MNRFMLATAGLLVAAGTAFAPAATALDPGNVPGIAQVAVAGAGACHGHGQHCEWCVDEWEFGQHIYFCPTP